ncbi:MULTISPECIES: DDE-type integrase/transposase/recombinase [unclassified Microcoleus]|uniref:DDE-type integrase/transposase/recombinase n=1 Tax=unclassified Microcoleus TaxID=2642155 RepID=UPI002FD66897
MAAQSLFKWCHFLPELILLNVRWYWELRQIQYLNNIIEQEHWNVKRIVKPMIGFQSFTSARRTLSGIEAMSTIPKGQVKGINKRDSVSEVKFI